MAGDTSVKTYPKQLAETLSTPAEDQDGHRVNVEMVKLVKYTVNVRSFHPNKKFEPLGFRFHGDDRGFSLDDSFHVTYGPKKAGITTSRIWQIFNCNLEASSPLDFSNREKVGLFTASNTSSGPWGFSDGAEPYVDKRYRPKGELLASAFPQTHNGEQTAEMTAWYGGENFAFLGSRLDQRTLNYTIVPTLDVFCRLWVKVERIRKWMDICVLVYGDGFPNCEAFIQDPKGTKIFLGTHVRIGTPATHLAGTNKRIMFANVVRVELDVEGNFGSRLWIFTQALGGTPDDRDDYPATKDVVLPKGSKTSHLSDAYESPYSMGEPPIILPGMDTVFWPADPISKIGDGVNGSLGKPLYISAYEDVDAVWKQLSTCRQKPPVTADATVGSWNDYHLHRNPNQGRSPDAEDLDPSKWKKK